MPRWLLIVLILAVVYYVWRMHQMKTAGTG